MKVNIQKKLMFITLVIVSIFSYISITSLIAEGTVDGEITMRGFHNNADISLLELAHIENSIVTPVSANDSVTPYMFYRATVRVDQIQGFQDLERITFKFFDLDRPETFIRESFDSYTTTGQRLASSEFMVSQDAFVVEWNHNHGSSDGNFRVVSGGAFTTWSLVDSSVDKNNENDQFTFTIDFRISKVASHVNAWYLGVLVEDGLTVVDPAPNQILESFDVIGPFNMQWYGEISVPDHTKVNWQNVFAGSEFEENLARPFVGGNLASINYLSNGYFLQTIGSSTVWEAVVPELPVVGFENFAYLHTASSIEQASLSDQEFSLRASVIDSFPFDIDQTIFVNDLLNTLNDHRFTLDSNDLVWEDHRLIKTSESGIGKSDLHMYLALGSIFQNSRYDGKLFLGISNTNTHYTFVESESQFKNALTTSKPEGFNPVYFRNGFLELSTPNETYDGSFTFPDGTHKRNVVGDLYITGDNINLSSIRLFYGNLYLLGNNITVDNIEIYGGDVIVEGDNNTISNALVEPVNPGGNLYFIGQNLVVDTSEFFGNAYISGSSTVTFSSLNMTSQLSSTYFENVYLTENSILNVDYFKIGFDAFITDSDLTMRNGSTARNIILNRSEARFEKGTQSRPGAFTSITMFDSTMDWVDGFVGLNSNSEAFVSINNGSRFTMLAGDVFGSVDVFTESEFSMENGKIHRELLIRTSVVHISGGSIGFNPSPASGRIPGIKIDNTLNITASSLTISGGEVRDYIGDFNAHTEMTGGRIYGRSDMRGNHTLKLIQGEIYDLYMQGNADLLIQTSQGFDDSSARIRRLSLASESTFAMDGGTIGVGDSSNSGLRLSNFSSGLVTSGSLSLGSTSNDNLNNQEISISSNPKRGVLVRDEANLTLRSSVTIGSSTQLELRDIGTISVQTTNKFNRLVMDRSATFNEVAGEGSSVNNDLSSVIEMYVGPSSLSTRTRRSGHSSSEVIAFDYQVIEGTTNSALAEARRVSEAFSYRSNIYVYNTYTYEHDASILVIDLDVNNVSLLGTSSRTNVNQENYTAIPGSNVPAKVKIPIRVTADSVKVQGMYFDLETSTIPITVIGLNTGVMLFENNIVMQTTTSEPIFILDDAKIVELNGSFLTRPSGNLSTHSAVVVSGSSTLHMELSRINNIGGHGLTFTNAQINNLAIRSSNFSNIVGNAIDITHSNTLTEASIRSSTLRDIGGHAIFIEGLETLNNISLAQNTIERTSKDAVSFINNDSMNELEFSRNIIRNISGNAVYIKGVITASGLMIDREAYQFISGSGFYLEASQTIENVRFNSNTQNLIGDGDIFPRNQIKDVQEFGIFFKAPRIENMVVERLNIENAAIKGISYASFYIEAEELNNFTLQQRLSEIYQFESGISSLFRVDSVPVSLLNSNGIGLAIKVESGSNNSIFNPTLQNNAIGLAFLGTGDMNEIFAFNTSEVALTVEQYDPRVRYGYQLFLSTLGFDLIGLKNNDINLWDATGTLDLLALRSDYLEFANGPLYVFDQKLMQATLISPNSIASPNVTEIAITTTNEVSSITLTYDLDDVGAITGNGFNFIAAQSGQYILSVTGPAGSTKATFTLQSGTTFTTTTVNLVGGVLPLSIPLATLNSGLFTPVTSASIFMIAWEDASGTVLETQLIEVNVTNQSQALITRLNSAGSSNFISVIPEYLKALVSSAIEENFYYTLRDNYVAQTVSTLTQFNTLFLDVLNYSEAEAASINYIQSITSGSVYNKNVLISDVIEALSGSSLTRTSQNGSVSSALTSYINLRDRIRNIDEEVWLIEDLSNQATGGIKTFDQVVSPLNSVVSSGNLDSLEILAPDFFDGITVTLATGTSIEALGTVIQSEVTSKLSGLSSTPTSNITVTINNWNNINEAPTGQTPIVVSVEITLGSGIYVTNIERSKVRTTTVSVTIE